MNTTLAPLDSADPQLSPLLLAAYGVESRLIGADIPMLHDSAVDVASAGLGWTGAWDGPRLVGAMAVHTAGAVADIHRLVVAPDAFRRGIASALLETLPERAEAATAAANAPARALYARHGFRVKRERVVSGGMRIVELSRP